MKLIKNAIRRKNDLLRSMKLKFLISTYLVRGKGKDLDPEAIKHVLILRLDDKIGDMIVATGLINVLYENNIKVSVLTGPVCHGLLSNSPLIEKCFIYKRRGRLINLQKERIDLVVDFDDVVSFERCHMMSCFNRAHIVGFNKINFPMYHTSLAHLDESSHITERHKSVIKLLNLTALNYSYSLPECRKAREKVAEVVDSIAYSHLIAINPLTGAEDKDFSTEQTQQIVDYIKSIDEKILVIIIGQESKIVKMGLKNVVLIPESTINVAVEIVSRCDFVISPDTSIVHTANTFNKPLLALYNKRKLKDTGLSGYNLWSPNYSNAKQVIVEEMMIREVPVSKITPLIDEILKPLIKLNNQNASF